MCHQYHEIGKETYVLNQRNRAWSTLHYLEDIVSQTTLMFFDNVHNH